MVLIAFAVRVVWIAVAHTYRIRTNENNFAFGWEIGRIAYSLANGMGFSSPFGGNTGPSAWTRAGLSLDRVAGVSRLRQLFAGRRRSCC